MDKVKTNGKTPPVVIPGSTYALEGEKMVYTSYKTSKGEIVPHKNYFPFYGQITEKLTILHEHGQEVVFTIEGEKSGRPYTTEVTAAEFVNPHKLYLALIQAMPGKPPVLKPTLRVHLEPAISALTDERQMKQTKAVTHTGWTPDGKAFVMPRQTVGRKNYVCKLGEVEHELNGFGLKKGTREEVEIAYLILLSLKKIYRPATIYTLIAHAFLPPLLNWVGNQARYMYHIHGETGALKTELAKIIMSLYGPLKSAAITYKWSDTPIGAEQRAHALKDCLMLIDDLKPSTITQNHRWVAFIQAAVDAAGRKRATITGKAGESFPPRALLLSTGETVPYAGEESYTARMIQARLEPQAGGWNDQLANVQEKDHLLSGLMYEYIDWLRLGNGRNALLVYKEKLAKAPTLKHNRLSSNFAANLLAAEMFSRFCLDYGLMAAQDGERFLAQHLDGLTEIITETAEMAHSERYSQRFVAVLCDMIETGSVHVAKHPLDKSPPQNYIGWFDKDYTYLHMGGVGLIKTLARRVGIDINIDRGTLLRQLYNDGMIHSTTARIRARKFDYQHPGTRKMVVAFFQEKLWPKEETDA